MSGKRVEKEMFSDADKRLKEMELKSYRLGDYIKEIVGPAFVPYP